MPGPLDWLLPGARAPQDPMAWLAANSEQAEGGLVPPDDPEMEDFWTPTASAPRTPTQPQGQEPGGVTQAVNEMPQQPTAGGGKWASWLEDPANRAFMISTGLQMMTGGWGDIGQQIGQALGHGFSAMSSTQQKQSQEQLEAGLPDRRGSGRGRRRSLGRGRRAQSTEEIAALDAAQELLASPEVAPEVWAQANQPGGVIHAVFGGPQDISKKPQLLQFVQDRQRGMPQPGARNQQIDGAELIEMLSSQDQGVRAEGQAWARRTLGSPGVGHMWGVDERGAITRVPVGPQRTSGGRGGGRAPTQLQENAMAAADSAFAAIQDMRDYVQNQGAIGGMIEREASRATGIGSFARIRPRIESAARAYMHGLSGAQVNIPETSHYVESLSPQAGDSGTTIMYKLDTLELFLRSLQQRQGAPWTDQELLDLRNTMRGRMGQSPLTMDQHIRTMRGGREAQPPGAADRAPIQLPPGPRPLSPSQQLNQSQQTPQQAPTPSLPPGYRQEGDTIIAPDGTRIRAR